MYPGWALAVLALVSAPPAPSPDLAPVIEEITELAAGEPPILGIDSQVRAAAALRQKRPEFAKRFLEDAASRAQTLPDDYTRSLLVEAIVKQLRLLDRPRAEELCRTLSRASRSPCYAQVITANDDAEQRVATGRRALAAGAFDTGAHRDTLQKLYQNHPELAGGYYAAILDAFPASGATLDDLRMLLSCVKLAGARHPALTREALDKAARAIRLYRFPTSESERSRRFPQGDTQLGPAAARDLLVQDILTAASTAAPDMVEPFTKDFAEIEPAADPPELPALGDERLEKEEESSQPTLRGLSDDDALDLIRRQSSALQRVGMFIELMDRDSIPHERKTLLAYEALEASQKMRFGENRLTAQSLLARRLHDWGDRPHAALAAQLLVESFAQICRCEDGGCDTLKGREDCAQRVNDFAEYLVMSGLQPEDLGLRHRSLRVRFLILQLNAEP